MPAFLFNPVPQPCVLIPIAKKKWTGFSERKGGDLKFECRLRNKTYNCAKLKTT